MKNKIVLDDITGYKFTLTEWGLSAEKYDSTKKDLTGAEYYATMMKITEEMKNAKQ